MSITKNLYPRLQEDASHSFYIGSLGGIYNGTVDMKAGVRTAFQIEIPN